MRRFRFVGSERDAIGYGDKIPPKFGEIYNEDDVFCEKTVLNWSKYTFLDIGKEWEEVFDREDKESI